MLLYTDGITEARDKEGAMFSSAKLERIFHRAAQTHSTVEEIQAEILTALQGYKCDDDVSFMIVQKSEI